MLIGMTGSCSIYFFFTSALVNQQSLPHKYYNKAYGEWQISLNKFGAKAKARYWKKYIRMNHRCVEFGCSTGYILHSLPCNYKVGVEANPWARRYAKDVLKLAIVERLSKLKTNDFDIVFTSSVLEHVECPICELREMHRILKPGGTVIITVPGMSPRSLTYHHNIDHHFYAFGALEAGNMLASTGFKIVECSSEYTQWPANFAELYDQVGDYQFQKVCQNYSLTHDKLITTHCVGLKSQ